MQPETIRQKAGAYRDAWLGLFAEAPSERNTVLGLSVAIHETQAGEAWPGSHNWGATTLRALTDMERAVLAAEGAVLVGSAGLQVPGELRLSSAFDWSWLVIETFGARSRTLTMPEAAAVAPVTATVGKGHEERARRAQQVIAAGVDAEGMQVVLPQGEIHCDSSPQIGPYFVWFATFPDDVGGAGYFQRILAGRPDAHKAAFAVLNGGDEQQLATAMYRAHYFTGFRKPGVVYKLPDGREVEGSQLNIDEYAGALRRISPTVRAALRSEQAGPVRRVIRQNVRQGPDVAEWEGILNRWLSEVGGIQTPVRYVDKGAVYELDKVERIEPDEHFGPLTDYVTRRYQQAHGLADDGIVGDKTWAAATSSA